MFKNKSHHKSNTNAENTPLTDYVWNCAKHLVGIDDWCQASKAETRITVKRWKGEKWKRKKKKKKKKSKPTMVE